MSVGSEPLPDPTLSRASAIARAARARQRADDRLETTITDFFLTADARLEERTRLMLAHVLRGIIGAIEADIRRHAARVLAGLGETTRAEAILTQGGALLRLTRSGVLRDRDLMKDLIARVRHDLIADALPAAIAGPEEPSLLIRLTGVSDTTVATAAGALLAAESRRRAANESGMIAGSDVPADLHRRLVWWVAAAVRDGLDDALKDAGEMVAMQGRGQSDQAITEAALRSLAAHDDAERPEAVAIRLAAAIDARRDELPALLVEALGDRRLTLFVAVLAHAIGIDAEQVRVIVLDPDGEQLWLALRAADLDRETIARIGLALADADPRRDIESFADALDSIASVAVDDARAAIAPLAMHREFRAALRALAGADRR